MSEGERTSEADPAAEGPPPFTHYQWKLFAFLSVATFFEGYDFLALTQLLPNFGAEWQLSDAAKGALVTVINMGTVLAYALVRQADRWGRRRVLTITIVGYAIFTALSGLAPNVWVFGGAQLVARIFLIGEWATSMVIAAEEFPAARRGTVIGVILAFNSFGAILCAGVVPLLLQTPVGWRTVYFVGVLPLIVVAFARRGLRETTRFTEQVALATARADPGRSRSGPDRSRGDPEHAGPAAPRADPERAEPPPADLDDPELFAAGVGASRDLFHIFRTPHRRRLVQVAVIWLLSYVCTHNAVTFWKEFVLSERGFTDADAGKAITIAAVAAMPLVFLTGKLLDAVGRKLGAVIVFGVGAAGIVLSYSLEGFWPLAGALIFGIYGTSAVAQVLNAYTTELFPTNLRGDAFAWANNLIGRIGYVFSPAAVGYAAGFVGWGPAVSATAIFQIAALVVLLVALPETKGRELEETAAV